jgi:uncharacterized protein
MTALRLWLCGLLLACLQCLGSAGAQQQAAVPALTRPVTDLTATLDAAQTAQLEDSLRAFEQRKGSQIAVLIVPSTKPEAIEQYALRVAEQWKIGRKKVDDGAILLVAKDDRALRIEVGYGLEGALNDATSKRIIEETITPRFRTGDYHGGIAAGLASMMKVAEGEPLPPAQPAAQGRQGRQEGGIGALLPVALVAAVVLGGVLRAVLGRFAGAAVTGGVIGVGAFLMAGALAAGLAGGVAFLVTLLGGGRMGLGGALGRGLGGGGLGGGFGRGGGLGGGGGGFGGGGGGGWSGGGGGFGGGGASGRW